MADSIFYDDNGRGFELVTLAADQTIASLKTFSRGAKIVDRYFTDDFDRADQAGLGTAPTGHVWALGGPATGAAISGGKFVADANTYANVTLSEPPLRIGGKFSFAAGPGGETAVMALILAYQGGANLLNDMIHCQFSRASMRVSLWTSAATTPPAFAATTFYAKDAVISEAGNRYAALLPFTSGATFAAANWRLLGANVVADSPMSSGDTLTATAAVAMDANPLTPGVEYEIQMTVVGNRVHMEISQDGDVLHVLDCADPRVSGITGSTPIYQIKPLTSSANASYIYTWHEVNAVRRQPTTVEAELDAPAGISGPLGAKYMSAVYAKRLGVGTQEPLYPLDVVYESSSALNTARIRAVGTPATVLIESEGAGLGCNLRFKIGGGTEANAPSIVANGASYDLDFHVGTTRASRLQLPSSTASGGIYLKGVPRWFTAALEQTTVGAAGAASAPPAAPTKWLKVMDSAGTSLVIPAYAAA